MSERKNVTESDIQVAKKMWALRFGCNHVAYFLQIFLQFEIDKLVACNYLKCMF